MASSFSSETDKFIGKCSEGSCAAVDVPLPPRCVAPGGDCENDDMCCPLPKGMEMCMMLAPCHFQSHQTCDPYAVKYDHDTLSEAVQFPGPVAPLIIICHR